MTERALPTIGVGIRPRPLAGTAPRGIAVPRAGTLVRPDTLRRESVLSTPIRAGMLVGASAAVYAAALVGISVLQSQQEAATAAARTPYLDALAETRAANDALAARIQAANTSVASLVADYESAGADIAAYQARLDGLAALVADVQGSAAALPARIKLPTVSIRGPIASSVGGGGGGGGGGGSAPKTSGKSGASGG